MDPVATPYIYTGQDQQGFILWDPRLTDELSIFHAVHVYFDQTCTWTEAYVQEIAHELPITRTTSATAHTIQPEHVSLSYGDDENVNTAMRPKTTRAGYRRRTPQGSEVDPLSLEEGNDLEETKASEREPNTPAKRKSTNEAMTPPQTPHGKTNRSSPTRTRL